MTNGSGATIVTTRRVAAPNPGDVRTSAIGLGLNHAHNLATKAKAASADQSSGDGWANAVICFAAMLACVLAYIVLAHAFMT